MKLMSNLDPIMDFIPKEIIQRINQRYEREYVITTFLTPCRETILLYFAEKDNKYIVTDAGSAIHKIKRYTKQNEIIDQIIVNLCELHGVALVENDILNIESEKENLPAACWKLCGLQLALGTLEYEYVNCLL